MNEMHFKRCRHAVIWNKTLLVNTRNSNVYAAFTCDQGTQYLVFWLTICIFSWFSTSGLGLLCFGAAWYVLQLRQLWPEDLVGPQALRDSDPRELVLAVRSLSPQGPPKRY